MSIREVHVLGQLPKCPRVHVRTTMIVEDLDPRLVHRLPRLLAQNETVRRLHRKPASGKMSNLSHVRRVVREADPGPAVQGRLDREMATATPTEQPDQTEGQSGQGDQGV